MSEVIIKKNGTDYLLTDCAKYNKNKGGTNK